jgi:hypothetical protein
MRGSFLFIGWLQQSGFFRHSKQVCPICVLARNFPEHTNNQEASKQAERGQSVCPMKGSNRTTGA